MAVPILPNIYLYKIDQGNVCNISISFEIISVFFAIKLKFCISDKAKNFEKIALKYYGKVRIARLTIKKKEFK